MISSLPLTRLRIFVAKVLYSIVKLFVPGNQVQVSRNGINYELDLSEGIDFSVYLFGSYQSYTSDLPMIRDWKNSKVLDVGANIGVMSLNYAKLGAEVHSFEPTDYAYDKFMKNLELNPELQKKVFATKALVGSEASEGQDTEIYSSWSLTDSGGEQHKVHGGSKKKVTDTPVITIDSYVSHHNLNSLELIKVDTDGFELPVLEGAKQTLKDIRPVVVFEIGLYLLNEQSLDVATYFDLFEELNYKITTLNGQNVSRENFQKYIPQKSTTDLLAVPVN